MAGCVCIRWGGGSPSLAHLDLCDLHPDQSGGQSLLETRSTPFFDPRWSETHTSLPVDTAWRWGGVGWGWSALNK